MEKESKAAFARRLNVNKSTITRAADAGRIVLDAAGQVLIEQSLALWHASKGGRIDVEARHAENRGAEVARPTSVEKNAAGGAIGGAIGGETNATPPATDAQLPPVAVAAGGRAQVKAIGLHFENSLVKIAMALRRGRRPRPGSR